MPGIPQAILANRLRKAATPVADYARASSARWSRRVPASVRLQGGASRITIAAGGSRAPQAYTMEGRSDGRPIAHPVYGHGPRVRGPLVSGPRRPGEQRRYDPPGWTWAKQTPRPFLREAIDVKQDEMLRIFAGVVDDWAHDLGYR
jgi:hypothetical protein